MTPVRSQRYPEEPVTSAKDNCLVTLKVYSQYMQPHKNSFLFHTSFHRAPKKLYFSFYFLCQFCDDSTGICGG